MGLEKGFWFGGKGTGAQWIAAIVTFLAVVVAFCTSYQAIEQAKLANQSNAKIIELMSETQLRPFIWIDWSKPQHLDEGDNIRIRYTVVNSGNSSAESFENFSKYSLTKRDSLKYPCDSDVSYNIYPHAEVQLMKRIPKALLKESVYFHIFQIYKYRSNGTELADSSRLYTRFETVRLTLLADNTISMEGIGSKEDYMRGDLDSCYVLFDHPNSSISPIRVAPIILP
jgi:hypothetical protein